ncbi:unnamed protein product [Chrysoparadoxa australica]
MHAICVSLACVWGEEAKGEACEEYSAEDVIGCFCLQALSAVLEDKGIHKGTRAVLKDDDLNELCYDTVVRYSVAYAMQMVMAVTIVLINVMLSTVLRKLSALEHHPSATGEAKSAAQAIFMAQFLNTAVIVTAVNAGALGNTPSPGGEPFTRSWYITVGSPISLMMLFNIVSPHVVPLLKVLVLQPLLIRFRAQKAVTQDELNRMHAGPHFKIEARMASLLNTVFVTWTYAGALPILVMFGLISFMCSILVDKLLLLRFYSRPPQYGASIFFLVKYLPWAAVMRLLVSSVAFSNPEILTSSGIGWAEEFIGTSYIEGLKLAPAQANVLPLLLVAAFVIAAQVFGAVAASLLALLQTGRDEAAKTPKPPAPAYSGPFIKDMTTNQQLFYSANGQQLARPDQVDGWCPLADGCSLYRKWLQEGDIDGVHHDVGEAQRTWEVIAEKGLHSYHINKNARYHSALEIMQAEGTAEAPEQEEAQAHQAQAQEQAPAEVQPEAADEESAMEREGQAEIVQLYTECINSGRQALEEETFEETCEAQEGDEAELGQFTPETAVAAVGE